MRSIMRCCICAGSKLPAAAATAAATATAAITATVVILREDAAGAHHQSSGDPADG